MAGENDKVAVPSADQALAGILQLLGGSKRTTNPGDITALQNSIAGLQNLDYAGMLQQIFQQASGQIPGIQVALGNATGTRSGNNSAVAAALQQLLKQTTVAAQDKIANQQLANQQAQIQAGSSIATATRGTTEKSGANLQQAAGLIALLTGVNKLMGTNSVQGTFEKLGLMGSSDGKSGAVSAPAVPAQAPAQVPAMSMAATTPFNLNNLVASSPVPVEQSIPTDYGMTPAPVDTMPAFDINSLLGGDAGAPQMSVAPEGFLPQFNINDYLVQPDMSTPDANWYDEYNAMIGM